MPDLETGFRINGFELLGWPEVGFIHFFSTKRISSIDDIKNCASGCGKATPWVKYFLKPLVSTRYCFSIMDVYTQLSTKHGSIDTVYTSAFGAIALQWYSKLKYATHIPLTNAIGSVTVSGRFFNKLPTDLQQLLKTTGKILGDKIRLQTRDENRRNIAILEKNSIEFMFDWDEVDMDEIISIRDNASLYLEKTNYIPADLFNKTTIG